MKIKDMANWFMRGAVASLGSLAVLKGAKVLQNSVRKEKMKMGFKSIKEAFVEKSGES